jgi:hypothetical protein
MLALMHEEMDHPLRRMMRKIKGQGKSKVGTPRRRRAAAQQREHTMHVRQLDHAGAGRPDRVMLPQSLQ